MEQKYLILQRSMHCDHFLRRIYTISFVSVATEKCDPEEEIVDTESENSEKLDDCDQRKTIKVKPFGGPLLAQV